MAPPTVPTTPPQRIQAGDSATWDTPAFTHPVYGAFSSADGWVLTTVFQCGKERLSITASVNADGSWRTALTSAQTKALRGDGTAPATLRYVGRMVLGSDALSVLSGTLLLYPEPTAAIDITSHAEKMVALLEAALIANPGDIISYQVDNSAVTRAPRSEVMKTLGYYRSQLWKEQNPGQIGIPVQTRFTAPHGSSSGAWRYGSSSGAWR